MVSPLTFRRIANEAAERLDEASASAIRRGGPTNVWQGITILSDPYSRSAQGEVVISALILLSQFRHHQIGAVPFKQQAQTSA